jgi:predicted NAD-dependent protein-ADP-ribosyltransferase YbiA (DUF1768 family)
MMPLKMMPQTIKFYHVHEPYGEFSNFLVRPIDVNDLTWPVGTEQFFHAMKTKDAAMQEHIRTKLSRPGQIKNFCGPGGGMGTLREDWDYSVQGLAPELIERFSDEQGIVIDRVKDHFMYQALVAKFTQHNDLAQLLLGTGEAHLIEDTQKVGSDPYWGNGPSGTGYNKLGRMLMLVRKALPRHLFPQTP